MRHQRVQRLRRLLSRASVRRSEGAFVIEGAKLIKAALGSGHPIESVYVAAGGRVGGATAVLVSEIAAAGARVFHLAPGVMERVAATVTPQPLCAVVPAIDIPLSLLVEGQVAAQRGDFGCLLVCIDVRDPGNLGAILRIAGASGVGGVVVCAGSVDIYNPKAVRASAGALFNVPIVNGEEPSTVIAGLRQAGYRLIGTRAAGGTDYIDADLKGRMALVLGNEGSGLPEALDSLLDDAVTIAMAEASESLNVAMAAAVLCFEARRRHPRPLSNEPPGRGGIAGEDPSVE
ncbi:MAG: TrmH family RNA methyltransferase [Acidimicrobiales bacterium]